MLKEFLKKDFITVKADAADWRGAVKVSGDKLIQNGIIEARYIQNMIKAVEELGPYIAIAPGVAIAHAKPEDGVIKTGIAITILKTPVNFGHTENDPISVIVTLAALDHDAHIDAMGDLMDVLENKYEDIVRAETPENIFSLFG
ncbi:MAG: PTS sugar transporter subunit IIA [Treponema sp.]|nr:PTS sugar transporter subunit IIA [Treponema sp.]